MLVQALAAKARLLRRTCKRSQMWRNASIWTDSYFQKLLPPAAKKHYRNYEKASISGKKEGNTMSTGRRREEPRELVNQQRSVTNGSSG